MLTNELLVVLMTVHATPDSWTLIRISDGYLDTLELIAKNFTVSNFYAFGLLSCLAIETALKAILVNKGVSSKDLKSLGHDLDKLWDKVFELGIRLDPEFKRIVSFYARQDNATVSFRYPVGGLTLTINFDENISDIAGIINDAKKVVGYEN